MSRLSVGILLGVGLLAAPSSGQQAAPKVVHIVAERFSFTPSEVTVDAGTTIEFRLTSDDTSHGFRLVGPGDIDVEIPKRGRGEIRVTFQAVEPGRYTFECSRVCGAGHSFMRGTIRVNAKPASAAAAGGDR
jgi:cytochrome c oxidase subunit 2